MTRARLMMISVATTTAARAWAGIGADELQWSQLPPLPEAVGVAGAFAGVSGGKLVVAGGANFPGRMPWAGGVKQWQDVVYVLDQTNVSWRVAGKLPRPLAYGVSLTTESGVLCIGGSDAMRHYADTFLLTEDGGSITIRPLPSLPVPLANAAGALVGTVAYVIGGAETLGEQAALSRFFALDVAVPAPTWRELPPFPGEARILAAAGATADALYLVGGAALRRQDDRVRRVYLRDAWKYSPASRNWKRLADLPRPSVAAPSPAPIIDATLLLVGGDDGSLVNFQPPEEHPGFPRVAQALDLRRGTWSQWNDLPVARATLPVVLWRGFFVLPSGEVRPGVRSPEVWRVRGPGAH